MLPYFEDILRLETRMKEEKLVDYFGNERNTEVIDDVQHLVRPYPQHLVGGQRESFCEFEGVYSSTDPLKKASPRAQLAPLGRLLTQVALDPRTTHTFPELLARLRFYTGAPPKTIAKIRNAGLAELSRRSSISMDDLFSDDAYRMSYGIASEELERKVCHGMEDVHVHRLITAAYCPPDQPLDPMTQWPSYRRAWANSDIT